MPTVLNILGCRVVIYPNDHRPAHIHVIGNGCEAVFRLNCPHGPPDLRENHGFTRSALSKILAQLAKNLTVLCTQWKAIHEHY
ncbi:DUF4160 domain-containing protein [Massilia arenae]|uniref:DUF4160 domain-containing protein n=1 Tax=Massilia arenae TaxID=2603288 RepID=A0A5C7G2J3_9BURK|nr:DUF4160 domain-containing protein [Massilia arenae]